MSRLFFKPLLGLVSCRRVAIAKNAGPGTNASFVRCDFFREYVTSYRKVLL